MAANNAIPPGCWPRLLTRERAAAYCGVSVNHFLVHVPVVPVWIGAKRLWDRAAIDRWLDGEVEGGDTEPTMEELLERA